MKKLLAIVLAAVASAATVAFMPACAEEESLVVGITFYEPMNYYDDSGKLVGFDTEFAEKALAELGYTPKFQEIDWDNKIFELQTGQIDLIWNGMTITDELKQSIAITDSYMENKQVVVVRAADAQKYSAVADLAKATSVAVEAGSAGESVCLDAGCQSLNKMTAQSDCLLEVKTGNSDIAVIDITMAKSMTGEGTDYADLTYVDVGFEGENYGIGLRKDDAGLLEDLNKIIAKYKEDGTFDGLIKKYMS